MPRVWGQVVGRAWEKLWVILASLPQLFAKKMWAGHKHLGFHTVNPQVLTSIFHESFTSSVSVFRLFIPTIHTTYKNKHNI